MHGIYKCNFPEVDVKEHLLFNESEERITEEEVKSFFMTVLIFKFWSGLNKNTPYYGTDLTVHLMDKKSPWCLNDLSSLLR